MTPAGASTYRSSREERIEWRPQWMGTTTKHEHCFTSCYKNPLTVNTDKFFFSRGDAPQGGMAHEETACHFPLQVSVVSFVIPLHLATTTAIASAHTPPSPFRNFLDHLYAFKTFWYKGGGAHVYSPGCTFLISRLYHRSPRKSVVSRMGVCGVLSLILRGTSTCFEVLLYFLKILPNHTYIHTGYTNTRTQIQTHVSRVLPHYFNPRKQQYSVHFTAVYGNMATIECTSVKATSCFQHRCRQIHRRMSPSYRILRCTSCLTHTPGNRRRCCFAVRRSVQSGNCVLPSFTLSVWCGIPYAPGIICI